MKSIREIIGLSLICVKEGLEYGHIKDVLFDPANGRIKYLIVDDGQWYLGAKLLPFEKVMGIGTDVITVESQENIVPFIQAQDALDLIKRDVKIIGSKVYTQKGEYIGEVKECSVCEQDGSISMCELSGKEHSITINASDILTYGKGVIIISGDALRENFTTDDKPDEQGIYEEHDDEPAQTA